MWHKKKDTNPPQKKQKKKSIAENESYIKFKDNKGIL